MHWLTGWAQPSHRDGPGRPKDAALVTEGRERYQGGINITLVFVFRYYFIGKDRLASLAGMAVYNLEGIFYKTQ